MLIFEKNYNWKISRFNMNSKQRSEFPLVEASNTVQIFDNLLKLDIKAPKVTACDLLYRFYATESPRTPYRL